jgi:hypothetical protein
MNIEVFLRSLSCRIRDQRGGFSPFMFGILAGMALFSASIRGHLEQELRRAEEAKLERTRQETQALARAVEAAVMTETSSTYSADITLNRILTNVDGTTGLTAGGSTAQINTFQSGPMARVMIGLTDDGYVRNELATATGDLTQSPLGARSDVAVVDVGALRTRQMELSLKNLDQEAGLLYYFWNRQNRFPTDQAEYKAQVNAVSGLRDFWGRDFTYTAVDANNGGLAFTTPWGEARSISVTMAVTTSPSTPPADTCTSIGQTANGGKCAQIGPNALIAATVDGSSSGPGWGFWGGAAEWGSSGVIRGTTNATNGAADTALLASFAAAAHPPAHFCAELVAGGYDDWYLPAIDELNVLYTQRTLIGGFFSNPYWSSTESTIPAWQSGHAMWRHFGTGTLAHGPKDTTVRVRCVRRAN